MSILENTLSGRDLLSQISNSETEISSIYVGFDATAKSLQIGNLVPLAALKHLSKQNIKIIVVLGGATSTIGDPSGKNTTRKQLENEEILTNLQIIHNQIKKLLPNAKIVNNFDWISKLSCIDLLDKIATYLPVSYIINFKTFADRLKNNNPLTMKEILYPLMQGYDFLYLFENEKCDAQLGGNDQWCNVLTGLDLIQRKYSKNTNVVAVTSPLLVDSSGNKMGKSLKGAIYLSDELCSFYDFWSFWRNIEDPIVKSCLLKFTELPLVEIDSLIKRDINEAKSKLADYLTTWVHSKEQSIKASKQSKDIFINKSYDLLPLIECPSQKIIEVISFLKNISNSESKRLIKNKAIKINDLMVDDINFSMELNKPTLIGIGKKNFYKIIVKK